MLQNQATYSFVLNHSYNVLHTRNQLNDLVEFSWINQEDDEKASTRPIRCLNYEYVLIIFRLLFSIENFTNEGFIPTMSP